MISLDEHLDHYPHYISSKEVSSISSRYQSFSSSAAFLQARVPPIPLTYLLYCPMNFYFLYLI